MRLVIKNARVLTRGYLKTADIVIEDDVIVGVTRSYRGPYDELLNAQEAIAIPGLTEPFVRIAEIYELYELAANGITQALVYLPGDREEFMRRYQELLSNSPIDLGFRSDTPSVAPWEAFGYVARTERSLIMLREAYDKVFVALEAKKDRKRLFKLSKTFGFKTLVVDPSEPVNGCDLLAIAAEKAIKGDPKIIRFSLEAINGRYKALFTDFSAAFAMSLILRGLSSRLLIERITLNAKLLGISLGLFPGSRANIVLLHKKVGSRRGMKTYFETHATIVGGRVVYYEREFVEQPRIAIINQGRALSYA